MGACECQKTSLMERNLDTNINYHNLIYTEIDPKGQLKEVEKVRGLKSSRNQRFKTDLQSYFEKSTIEEFNRLTPMKYQDYARENPVLLNYDGDSSKLIEEEPVKLLNGNLYWGCWNEKYELEGTGKMFLVEESIFVEGIWKEGVLTYGRIMFSDGKMYEGSIVDCAFDGTGKLIFPDGAFYEGNFKNGDRNGRGHMVWPDNSNYWGEFEYDQLEGTGEFSWANGVCYKGSFKSSRLNGKGELSLGKKNKYNGDFVDNMFCGKGKFIWEEGPVYNGNYLNGKKQGKGKYVIQKGLSFKGKFYDEKPHGIGELSTDGMTYKGLWRNGELIEKGDTIKKDATDKNDLSGSAESEMSISMRFEVRKENLNPLELPYLDQSFVPDYSNFLPKEDIRKSLGEFE